MRAFNVRTGKRRPTHLTAPHDGHHVALKRREARKITSYLTGMLPEGNAVLSANHVPFCVVQENSPSPSGQSFCALTLSRCRMTRPKKDTVRNHATTSSKTKNRPRRNHSGGNRRRPAGLLHLHFCLHRIWALLHDDSRHELSRPSSGSSWSR